MDPLSIAAASMAAASIFGAERANRMSRAEAQRNRAFQERMSNTQWQRGIEDMRRAGVNPALAYSKGPATAPGGAMAAQNDAITPGVSSALSAMRVQKEVELLDAQVNKTKSETEKIDWQGIMEKIRATAYGGKRKPDGSIVLDTSDNAFGLLRKEIQLKMNLNAAQAQKLLQQISMNQPLLELMQDPGGSDRAESALRVLLGMVLGRIN